MDFIKVPSLIKIGAGAYVPHSLRIDRQKAKAIRSATIRTAVMEFKPDIFLVDHVPSGVYGELLTTLRRLDRPPVTVLGLRDIIDEPDVVTGLWRKEMTYQTIRDYYDEVLIYGSKESFDGAHHYGLYSEFPGNITCCGYVCPDEPLKSKEQIRSDLRREREKLVLVTAGGGHDAYPLMQSCLDAFYLMGRETPVEAVFITGPLMEPEQREYIRTRARGVAARVFTSVEDSPSFINAADLVITMAGYNSLCEVVSLKRKALVVPRVGPRAEQRMRAQLFRDRGLIDVLDPREVSPRILAQRIIEDLHRSDFPAEDATLDASGARNVARRLSELASQKGRPLPRETSMASKVGSNQVEPTSQREGLLRSNQASAGK